MINIIKYLKDIYPNVYIIIIAICVTMWFKGINIILGKIIKNDSVEVAILLITVSLIVLYMDDGSLTELKNIRRNAAVNMTNNDYDYNDN